MRYLGIFPAVLIEGPKGCGKSTLGEHLSKSTIFLQDPDERFRAESLIGVGRTKMLLDGETPRLIDEWQDFPVLWDAVRHFSDRNGGKPGQFILTGSSVPKDSELPKHTGTGRFARMNLRTMSLYESRESSGEVSLRMLFENVGESIEGSSRIKLEDVSSIIIRGGWPLAIRNERKPENIGAFAEQYVKSIISTDVNRAEGGHRSPYKLEAFMRALARATATSTSIARICADMSSVSQADENTVYSYHSALSRIFTVEDLPAWSMKLRSRTTIRTTPVHHFSDPSIAAALLDAGEGDLLNDPETFGLLFESLVIHDLRVYADCIDGSVSHYRDKNGLEADAVVHLPNGRWGAIEVKLGPGWIEDAAKHLMNLKKISCNEPSFLMVIIPEGDAYTRKDGIHVCPIGCLAP